VRPLSTIRFELTGREFGEAQSISSNFYLARSAQFDFIVGLNGQRREDREHDQAKQAR
jgi:hypothetical protein